MPQALDDPLARRNALLAALHQTALGLLESHDPAGMLEDIVRRACDLVGAPEGYVYTLDERDQRLVVRAAVGPHVAKYLGLRLGKGEGIAGRVWETDAQLAIDDYARWPGRSPQIELPDVRAVVALPLRARGRFAGVLGIFHHDEASRFDEEARRLLERYAQLASVALDHATLVAQLRESQESFRVAFEHAPVGRGLSSPDGRWLRVNPALCELVGYTEDEMLAMTSDQMTHPEDVAATRAARETVISGKQRVFDLEKRYVRKDGGIVYARVVVSCVRDAQGRPRFLVGDIQDLAERREQAVARTLVRALLRDVAGAGALPPHVLRETGRRLATTAEGTMEDRLRAFAALGLGRLEVHQHEGARVTFHGRDLLEQTPGATQPSCRLALGFAEGAYRGVIGHEGLGTELRCQSQGHPACVFVVGTRR
ncbi:MAG: hypothetical protein QOE90_2514 [Thermoplasmata archaeon]|jgi:PAS domain S-box-containing protein|nr:hypothetical protein [Thermoplasmata archaeon]